jgi:hypothetical protein
MIDGVIGDNFRLDLSIYPSAEKLGPGIIEASLWRPKWEMLRSGCGLRST